MDSLKEIIIEGIVNETPLTLNVDSLRQVLNLITKIEDDVITGNTYETLQSRAERIASETKISVKQATQKLKKIIEARGCGINLNRKIYIKKNLVISIRLQKKESETAERKRIRKKAQYKEKSPQSLTQDDRDFMVILKKADFGTSAIPTSFLLENGLSNHAISRFRKWKKQQTIVNQAKNQKI